MRSTTTSIVFVSAIIILLLLPRLAFLGNGLDAQRIWDTVAPETFRFLEAARSLRLVEFWGEDHKYPLLGPYTLAPVAAGYYLVNRLLGNFTSAEDFINHYALGETNIFFWLRLEMLTLNLVAIWLLYRLAVRFAGGARVGLYLLAFAAADLYLALFSVTPRIHNFAFLGTVLTLYASFLLLEKKSWRNYILAFGAAGVAVSLSQSGITTLILPVLAHFYAEGRWRWREWRRLSERRFLWGLVLMVATALVIGYPQLFLSLFGVTGAAPGLLSQEHTSPVFAPAYLWRFLKDFFVRGETAVTLLLAIGAYQLARRKLTLGPPDVLALAQLVAFLIIFGASSVVTGRFALVILPSLFFLAARVCGQIDRRRWSVYPVLFLLALQGSGVIHLIRIGSGGDTRASAASSILTRTAADVAVITTVDHHLLGIVPTPVAVKFSWARPQGAIDALIADRSLAGYRSRLVVNWDGEGDIISKFVELPVGAILIEGGSKFAREREYLEARQFQLTEAYHSDRQADINQTAYLNWDMPVTDSWLPMALVLQRYRALGPNLYLFTSML